MAANALIAARIAQPDMQGLGAESIVAALNAPDPSLPAVVERRPTRIGPGTVMGVLGATAGAALLDTLTALAPQSPPIRWALRVIDRGELDLSVDKAREQIDTLAAGQVMTIAQAGALKATAEHTRHLSWAENHSITVDAQAVRAALGAAAPSIWLPAGTAVAGTPYVVCADGRHLPGALVGCALQPGDTPIVQYSAAHIAASGASA